MAVQNSTITVKGKLGNIVGYKGRGGRKLARIRQTEVYNPKTDGQVIQRMILATAAKAYGRTKGITDHSFQAISYGEQSQSYFLKRAMEDIRNFVAKTYPKFPDDMKQLPGSFVGLAEPKSPALAGLGLLVSEGSIPTVEVHYAKVGDETTPKFVGYGNQIGAASVSAATVAEVLRSFGAEPGDQITTVILATPSTLEAGLNFEYSRLVVNASLSDADLAKFWAEEVENLRSGAETTIFDKEKSIIGNAYPLPQKIIANMYMNFTHVLGYEIYAGAFIISRKVGTEWLRSTQRLYWLKDGDSFGSNFAEVVVPKWKEGTTPIDTNDPYYLNNADQAGE